MPRQTTFNQPLLGIARIESFLGTTFTNETRAFYFRQWLATYMGEFQRFGMEPPLFVTTGRYGEDASMARVAFGLGLHVHLVLPPHPVARDTEWPQYCQTFEMVPNTADADVSLVRVVALSTQNVILMANLHPQDEQRRRQYPAQARADDALLEMGVMATGNGKVVVTLPTWDWDARGN